MGGLLAVAALFGVIWLVGSSSSQTSPAPAGQPPQPSPPVGPPKNYAVVRVPGDGNTLKLYNTLAEALGVGNGVVLSPTSGYNDGSPDGSVQLGRARNALLPTPQYGWPAYTYAAVYDTTTGLIGRFSNGQPIITFP